MVNGTNLTSGSIAWLGACGGGRLLGVETRVNDELAELLFTLEKPAIPFLTI